MPYPFGLSLPQEADRIFQHRFYAPMVHQTYIEPHAVLARVDASGKAT